MTLSLPLAQTWFAGLPVRDSVFHLPSGAQMSRARGGDVLTAAVAERLWVGQMTLAPMRFGPAAAVQAILSALAEPGATFVAHPMPLFRPQADPAGAILGAATPTIHTLTPGGRTIRLQGLPNGYVLSVGDYLGFSYGTNPTRRALHQVVTAATAAVGGVTPLFEVTPRWRAGAAVGAVVTLIRPAVTCVLLPGEGVRALPGLADGATLSFVQTLR